MHSIISNLKLFHNWVKKEDLNAHINLHQIVIDVCSGVGGDLTKICHLSPSLYICLEKDPTFIEQSKARYNTLTLKHRIPNIKWIQCDLTQISSYKMLVEKQILSPAFADVFSLQFAFTYFCESLPVCLNFLSWISFHLKPGGYFIGTTVDGEAVLQLLQNSNQYSNSVGTITKLEKKDASNKRDNDASPHKKLLIAKKVEENGKELNDLAALQTQFGQQVQSELKESILGESGVSEFLVPFSAVKLLCESVSLQLVQTEMFAERYKTYPTQSLLPDEQTFSFLSRSFVFQKKN